MTASNNKVLPVCFININKPKGWTSFDVVARLRRILGIKQIGHSGTLDPFATGVLPIAIGKATKLLEYLDDDKEYIATVQLGRNTDTYDLEGKVTEVFDTKVSQLEFEGALKHFHGEISQLPPVYSAIKVKGKKLYEYARAGENVEIKPRMVKIYKAELKEFDEETQIAKIIVACSKGTYIRSIAYDIGKMLGCGGHLIALERTKSGKFYLQDAVNIDDIVTLTDAEKYFINPLLVMNKPTYDLTEAEWKKVSHGIAIVNNRFANSDIVFLIYSGRIYAIGVVSNEKILVKKVFEVL